MKLGFLSLAVCLLAGSSLASTWTCNGSLKHKSLGGDGAGKPMVAPVKLVLTGDIDVESEKPEPVPAELYYYVNPTPMKGKATLEDASGGQLVLSLDFEEFEVSGKKYALTGKLSTLNGLDKKQYLYFEGKLAGELAVMLTSDCKKE